MRVTLIGPGNMGRGIATRLLSGGHAVTLVGRDREQAEALASELETHAGGQASIAAASSSEEAIPDSDVVILALPYAASLAVAQQNASLLGGKVVVDISNPVNESFTGLVTEEGPSAAETIQAALPSDAKVVKAFNTIFAGTLLKGEVAGQMLDVFIAGDHEGANGAVVEMVRSSGLRPIPLGGLERARQLEALGFLGMAAQERLGTGFMTGWKLLLPGTAAPTTQASFPRDAVVGVLDDARAIGNAVRALVEAGIDEAHVHVLYGSEGKQRIQSAGVGGDVISQLFGYEHEHTRRHLQELDAGRALVVVEIGDDGLVERAGEVLASHGGHFINYYSRWTTRSIKA